MPRSQFPTLFCGAVADAREIRELQRLATAVYFRSGTPIFSEGEPAASLFGLSQGVAAEEKVAIFLVSWRNRLARLSVFSETVPLPMRRQDIADFLGLKLETVSRTLAKLEQRNVIRLVPKGVFLTGLEQTLLVKGRSFQPQI